MHSLELHPGPCLLKPFRNEETGKREIRDVTGQASEYLFEEVELKGVTLADVFRLVERNPVLLTVYRRFWVKEYLEESQKGPLEPSGWAEDSEGGLDYLQLKGYASLHSGKGVLHREAQLRLEGVGVERTKDFDQYGTKAGQRTTYGLTGSHVRALLPLEVRYDPKVVVVEDDIARKRHMRAIREETEPVVLLGDALSGIFWNLSFHGSVEETQEFAASLAKQMEDMDSRGTQNMDGAAEEEILAAEKDPNVPVPVFSGDYLFGQVYSRVAHVNFVSTTLKHKDLHHAIQDMEDDVLVREELAKLFEAGSYMLKPECEGLTAYELRTRTYEHRDADAREAGDAAAAETP